MCLHIPSCFIIAIFIIIIIIIMVFHHFIISCYAHVGRRGELCASCCLQMGAGAAPPPKPPVFSGHSCSQLKADVMTMFAVREGCANHFVCEGGGGVWGHFLKAIHAFHWSSF